MSTLDDLRNKYYEGPDQMTPEEKRQLSIFSTVTILSHIAVTDLDKHSLEQFLQPIINTNLTLPFDELLNAASGPFKDEVRAILHEKTGL